VGNIQVIMVVSVQSHGPMTWILWGYPFCRKCAGSFFRFFIRIQLIKSSLKSYQKNGNSITIWLFNIAMENGPFIDGLRILNGDFPWLC
jgi:hypothetical protein